MATQQLGHVNRAILEVFLTTMLVQLAMVEPLQTVSLAIQIHFFTQWTVLVSNHVQLVGGEIFLLCFVNLVMLSLLLLDNHVDLALVV